SPAMFNHFEVVNDKVFKVTLDKVDCNFLNKLVYFTVMPKHIFGPDPKGVSKHPNNLKGGVSSGPYYVVEYKPAEYLRLQANPYYFLGEPKIKNVTLPIVTDTSAMNLMLQGGKADLVRMTIAQYNQLSDPSQFVTYKVPNGYTTLMEINQADPSDPQPAYDKDG